MFLVPAPRDYTILGFFQVQFFICNSFLFIVTIQPNIDFTFTRAQNDNMVNIMATVLKRKGMLVQNCCLESVVMKVRRDNPYVTVYSIILGGRIIPHNANK